MEADASAENPWICFVTGTNATVRLQLVDQKHLLGTLAQIGSGRRGSDNRPVLMRWEITEAFGAPVVEH